MFQERTLISHEFDFSASPAEPGRSISSPDFEKNISSPNVPIMTSNMPDVSNSSPYNYTKPGANTDFEHFLAEMAIPPEMAPIDQLEPLIPKLFKKLRDCITGGNIQVNDRSMCMFENDSFLRIVKKHSKTIFPILVPGVVDRSEEHWNKHLMDSY